MAQTLWKELIEIPERVYKSDFVLSLSEGVSSQRRKTVESYVVTENLAARFNEALGMIRAALTSGSSQAAYLHGSFGSGKSHFMAILDLLLEDRDNVSGVRDLERLEPVLAEHRGWLGEKRLLMVPYHFIGAASMEAAVLGGYVDFVRKLHPEAPHPPVYVSDAILENAEQLRERMGDAAFFELLNSGEPEPGGDAGEDDWGDWGDMAAAAWDRARYDAARGAAPTEAEHRALVSAVVGRVLTSVQDASKSDGERFVSLDEGLSILSRHAMEAGYDGVILFLDELVLWLASRASDLEFINREGQKLSKLVEAQNAARPVPIISFVARQRDLREFIGESHTGAAQTAFSDSLRWWEGRFSTITLPDKSVTTRIRCSRSPIRSFWYF